MTQKMQFTGERFVPQVHGNIELEHMHRYLMACDLGAGKDVLDIACGEGYGTEMMARTASKVYGVDISGEAISHAKAKYLKDNIEFMIGSCDAIPLPDQSVDLVVSFETIEHHDKHEEMMLEIKRVLRPDGVVLISSPDKQVYSIDPAYKNPFHVKELLAIEFKELLSNHFSNTNFFGQKIVYGSTIMNDDKKSSHTKSYWENNNRINDCEGIHRPVYIIAVASDAELPLLSTGMYERHESHSEFASQLRAHISNLNLLLSRKCDEVRVLELAVQSAILFQIKTFIKRIFHKGRPPHVVRQKVHFFKRLERSIRKRRKKFFAGLRNINLGKPMTIECMTELSKKINILSSVNPEVSIIIPVYGQIEYTLRCLKSIADLPPQVEIEVIVVDDCSPDTTKLILANVTGIKMIANEQNLGFIRSSNAGAASAQGTYLYFLNNDTQVTPGWLDELICTFQRFPETGLVGSNLVYPDGSLQEAGGIIWKDGSAWNFGRDQDASLPVFNYAREVDYCSGASIMVPKSLFDELGGFDEHYLPAYCEDSDLALKIREKGYRVIYQPLSEVIHFEGVSSGTDTSMGVKAYQVENMKKVFERWKHRLESHQPNAVDVDNAKDRMATRRVLFLDQRTPTPDMDSGSIDAFNTMMLLRDMGFQVTFIPVSDFHNDRKYTSAIQAHGIEALYRPYVNSVSRHLAEHGKRYDLIFACRYNTLEPHYHSLRKYSPQAKILFHTVDLHFLREKREADLLQDLKLHENAKRTEDIELKLIKACELTTVVSHVEKQVLNDMGMGEKVRVMPYSRHIRGTSVPFSQRSGIVFVGGFLHTPNVDAVNYFVHQIMPHLRPLLPDVIFHVVGSKMPDEIRLLEAPDVRLHGYVEDLEPLLDQMRVSVAPLRYGAGIKGKVGSAMCAGLPVVASPLATEGMNLTHGENVSIAKDPKEYAACIAELYNQEDLWDRISKNGLVFAEKVWGSDSAIEILTDILIRCDFECPNKPRPTRLWR